MKKALIIILILAVDGYLCLTAKSMLSFSISYFALLIFLIIFAEFYISNNEIERDLEAASNYEYQSTKVYDWGSHFSVRTTNHTGLEDLGLWFLLIMIIPITIMTCAPYLYYTHNKGPSFSPPHWLYGECILSFILGCIVSYKWLTVFRWIIRIMILLTIIATIIYAINWLFFM